MKRFQFKSGKNYSTLLTGAVLGVLATLVGFLLFYNLRTIQNLYGFVIGVSFVLFIIFVSKKIKSEETRVQTEEAWNKDVGKKVADYLGIDATEAQLIKLGRRSLSNIKTIAAGFSLFAAIALAISIGSLYATMLQVKMSEDQNNLVCEQNRAADINSWSSKTNIYTSALNSFLNIYGRTGQIFSFKARCETQEEIIVKRFCFIEHNEFSSLNTMYIQAMSMVAPYTRWEDADERLLDFEKTQELFDEISEELDLIDSLEDQHSYKDAYQKYITKLSKLYHQARLRKQYLIPLIKNQQLALPERQCN